MRVPDRRLWAVQQASGRTLAVKADSHLYFIHRTLTGSHGRLGDGQVRAGAFSMCMISLFKSIHTAADDSFSIGKMLNILEAGACDNK
jgi:hypothetical protein